jgi:hypothetical protein
MAAPSPAIRIRIVPLSRLPDPAPWRNPGGSSLPG